MGGEVRGDPPKRAEAGCLYGFARATTGDDGIGSRGEVGARALEISPTESMQKTKAGARDYLGATRHRLRANSRSPPQPPPAILPNYSHQKLASHQGRDLPGASPLEVPPVITSPPRSPLGLLASYKKKDAVVRRLRLRRRAARSTFRWNLRVGRDVVEVVAPTRYAPGRASDYQNIMDWLNPGRFRGDTRHSTSQGTRMVLIAKRLKEAGRKTRRRNRLL